MQDPIKPMASHDQGTGSLGPDDYAQLYDLMMRQDPRAQKLVSTLTPDEQQAFYDYQQSAHGKSPLKQTPGSNIMGIPIEAPVAGGVAAMAGGASLAGGMMGQMKDMGTLAIKAKILSALGLPPWMAMVLQKGSPTAGGMAGAMGEGPLEEELARLGIGKPAINATMNGRSGGLSNGVPSGGLVRPSMAAQAAEGELPSMTAGAKVEQLPNLLRSRPGEVAGRSLDAGAKVSGSGVTRMRDPRETLEFPPGTDKSTKPGDFLRLANDSANSMDDYGEGERIMNELKRLLDQKLPLKGK